MSKKYRVPQVPSEPMPELAGFLAPFRVRFRRVESQAAMERYITGLLTDHLNKNCDTLADILPGTSVSGGGMWATAYLHNHCLNHPAWG